MAKEPSPRGFFHLADVVVASSLTPLHPGAGRSPGVVDLPVVRDPFGFPYLPGSEFKGALKSTLAQKLCLSTAQCIDNRGFLKCGDAKCSNAKCGILCCLLGPEPGEGDKGASAVAFTELLPILFPVPSLEYGYVYATSPYLAARGLAVLDTGIENHEAKAMKKLLKNIVEAEDRLKPGKALALKTEGGSKDKEGDKGTITIGLDTYEVEVQEIDFSKEFAKEKPPTLNSTLWSILKKLNPMYEAGPIEKRLYVFSDSDILTVIEKAFYRVTRVAIRRDTKTVSRGALWTEEYLPPGTLFLGLAAYNAGRNEYCRNNEVSNAENIRSKFHDLLGHIGGKEGFTILIGGKETIGKGLLRASILDMGSTGKEGDKA